FKKKTRKPILVRVFVGLVYFYKRLGVLNVVIRFAVFHRNGLRGGVTARQNHECCHHYPCFISHFLRLT
ncbi:hypothetical protein, partial [Enterobacter hormaechei]